MSLILILRDAGLSLKNRVEILHDGQFGELGQAHQMVWWLLDIPPLIFLNNLIWIIWVCNIQREDWARWKVIVIRLSTPLPHKTYYKFLWVSLSSASSMESSPKINEYRRLVLFLKLFMLVLLANAIWLAKMSQQLVWRVFLQPRFCKFFLFLMYF